MVLYLGTTRFNKKTYQENINYRKKFSNDKIFYGSSIQISDKYPLGVAILVIEMNNDMNKIEGIGFITNKLCLDTNHTIYSNSDFNRFVYQGKYWISRNIIKEKKSEIIEILEFILFKGKSHLKRQSGISIISESLFNNIFYKEKPVTEYEIKNTIVQLFIEKYNKK